MPSLSYLIPHQLTAYHFYVIIFYDSQRDLQGSVPAGEDPWEVWDHPLNSVLQKGHEELQLLVSHRKYGLPALYNLLNYLTMEYNIDSSLFENKVKQVLNAIQESIPNLTPDLVSAATMSESTLTTSMSGCNVATSGSSIGSLIDDPEIVVMNSSPINQSFFKLSH
ncbi:hypothetical protein CPB84DRAFT_1849509 [Gymnopilus junonius]|uniref:Uncharacterized protein n=1 Tax=Gymnopilus junonius TaxID=109634 RepID=A0A9P5TJN9_GYMJU|nr:hypothetical protein CPB84DRAFT_1849509 [Gymnopilus junonius]